MIELTYIEQRGGNTIRKYFKTWKELDKFVMSQKIKKYKVKGGNENEEYKKGNWIEYTSVGWEKYMAKVLKIFNA